jgi:uncharacterized membrane protein YgcG
MSSRLRYPIAILSLAVSAPVLAQQPAATRVDPRWTAWLGCWQQLEETVKNENLVEAGRHGAVPTKGVVVCVTPADGAAAVTFKTIIEKQAALEDTIVADGSDRAIDQAGCQGSQRARWSENGRRLFTRAELSCADGTKREISGLATMAPGPVWVDIQVANSNGRESIRVRRYRRSPDQSYASSTLTREQLAEAASAAARKGVTFTIGDVKEATTQLAPSALEAALIETDAGFPLNATRLKELAAAGVPDRVLDLMIALSFPNHFIVERRTSASQGLGLGWIGDAWMAGGYDLFGYDFFPYRYAPFGYGMWGGYDSYYLGARSPGPQPSGEGRVVDGLGYSRVRSRDPQPRGGVGSHADGSGSSSSGGGSSGGVTSQGYSGGGGGDSGRTAVPRP